MMMGREVAFPRRTCAYGVDYKYNGSGSAQRRAAGAAGGHGLRRHGLTRERGRFGLVVVVFRMLGLGHVMFGAHARSRTEVGRYKT